jgi:hypothetical protein
MAITIERFSVVLKRAVSSNLTELRELFFEVRLGDDEQFYVPDLVEQLLKEPEYKDYEYEETKLC